jgi:hypothetical protein
MPQCHFVHDESHVTCPGSNWGLESRKPELWQGPEEVLIYGLARKVSMLAYKCTCNLFLSTGLRELNTTFVYKVPTLSLSKNFEHLFSWNCQIFA